MGRSREITQFRIRGEAASKFAVVLLDKGPKETETDTNEKDRERETLRPPDDNDTSGESTLSIRER